MLYTSTSGLGAYDEAYKNIVNKLKTEEGREAAYMEIKKICDDCRPSSPLKCVEFCPIWELKREHRELFKAIDNRPSFTKLVNTAKKDVNLKILDILVGEPQSFDELVNELEDEGCDRRRSANHYFGPLVKVGLVEEKQGLYKITFKGKVVYNFLRESEPSKLPINFKGYEEKILRSLLLGSKSLDQLVEIVPKTLLYRSLKRLENRSLITKSNPSGRIFYFTTKKRPTRKLTPIETKLFKALTREEMSVRELSERIGISVGKVYSLLRRLRLKRHVKKKKKFASYRLTDAGTSLAQSLNILNSLI